MQSSKLPLPKFPSPIESDESSDYSTIQPDGRIRSYPHVRGQWTTFVYSELPDDSLIDLSDCISSCGSDIQLIENIHVSMVRGHYALSFHQITPFVTGLRDKLSICQAFDIYLSVFKLFTNEESTRSFICLCEPKLMVDSVNTRTSRYVLDLIKQTLDDYNAKVESTIAPSNQNLCLDDFTFHTSIAWCLPGADKSASNLIAQLNELLDEPIKVHVDTIKINTGNICHTISLKDRT
ncbi:U6 snRNA phosphodiesterase [Tetranychus urticae]|uniref:U6 snRNA phosphodiesterase 1 n=1 Tax=Tetranychus urticae TaxID=32264 RepID=T1JZT8_TETUR|nr:U6 snRNA phosphodiesterase [Tetranychus urticae]